MKPILVHCHIFYPELWAELKSCIQNIAPHKFDLFVTMVEAHPDITQDIQHHFPDARIHLVPNVGYDIAPFVFVINQINLADYSYIVKLHTKRSIAKPPYFHNLKKDAWKNTLLSFIKTQDAFNQCIHAFEQNTQIGMINNYRLLVKNDIYAPETQKKLLQFLQKHNLPKIKYRFIGGTMFIARAAIFAHLKNLHITTAEFPAPDDIHSAQLAHIIERFLGYSVYLDQMIITDISKSEKFISGWLLYRTLHDNLSMIIKKFFYQKKITKSGKLLIKICRIPLLSKNTTK